MPVQVLGMPDAASQCEAFASQCGATLGMHWDAGAILGTSSGHLRVPGSSIKSGSFDRAGLGPSWGYLAASLGPSWGSLGAVLGTSLAYLRVPGSFWFLCCTLRLLGCLVFLGCCIPMYPFCIPISG